MMASALAIVATPVMLAAAVTPAMLMTLVIPRLPTAFFPQKRPHRRPALS